MSRRRDYARRDAILGLAASVGGRVLLLKQKLLAAVPPENRLAVAAMVNELAADLRTDAERVARGLTQAQRAVVIAAEDAAASLWQAGVSSVSGGMADDRD